VTFQHIGCAPSMCRFLDEPANCAEPAAHYHVVRTYTLSDSPNQAFKGEDVLCHGHGMATLPPGSNPAEQDWIECTLDCGRCYACDESANRQQVGPRATLAGTWPAPAPQG
jgi:hypothetical protein